MDIQTQTEGPEIADDRAQRLAKGLGVFSLGLGLAEVAAPRALARLIGVDQSAATPWILRALGAREIGHGLGIFARPKSVWTRLIGDAIDVAYVAWAFRDGKRSRLWPTMGALAAVGALDVLATLAAKRSEFSKPVTSSMTINRSPEECYARWRNFSQLPQFMRYLESVTELDERRSHWVAKSPIGVLEWDAEITAELPGRSIAWQSVSPHMPLRGRVTFEAAPGGRGTEICVEMQTAPFAKLFTRAEVNGDLRRFKQVLETGEVVVSDATSVPGLHPAQPAPQGVRR
ncbi:MAG: SRPBCC family protein [Deltaproteobacteria bacterium]|nr:SRPBCC family protein [Deltaproteobacteria bacterium]